LVVQFELAATPLPFQELLGDQGYLQLFYCISSGCGCPAAWEPQAGNRLLRWLREDHLVEAKPPDLAEAGSWGAAAIEGWVEQPDAPGWEERQALWPGVGELYGSWLDELPRVVEEPERLAEFQRIFPGYLEHFRLQPDELAEVAAYFAHYGGDKLMGWPAWSQAVDYPSCADCGQLMTMAVQINNDGGGPESFFGQLFAADGNGHIFACPVHKQLAFAWACG
jgi:hypothetical protein